MIKEITGGGEIDHKIHMWRMERNHMGGSPIPLPVITWTAVHHNLGATNLVSNHSVLSLYLDNTFQHLEYFQNL